MGKQVGRLSIRILPDATTFRADLSKIIKRVEKTMVVHLKVRADTREAELELARFRTTESGKSIGLNAAVNTVAAKGQLLLLARDRFVAIRVRLDKAAVAKVVTGLEALSGFRVAKSVFGDVTDALKDIDLNVPKIARVALSIGSLASMALTSSAGLVTLAGDLTKMGNAGLLLPAIFGGMAVGVGTLIAALKDGQTQLADLAPMFHELQDTISANFWEKAKAPIVDFMQSILPQLRTGFGLTATALGNQAAAIASAFQVTFADGVLDGMFAKLGQTMDIVTTGAKGFAEAVTTLGVTGSNYLPRLATWVVDIGNSFNTWLQVSQASGALDKYIEDGITQIKLFGSSVGSVISILRGIDRAATAAGATGLTSFAANLKGAAEIINSPKVQSALTTILTGANTAIAGLGGGIDKVGGMLVAIAPQISTSLGLAGEAVGGLVGAIADAMAGPEFSTGLVNLFEGLKTGVDALAPAMPPLIDFIGQLGTTVGVFAAQIGPLLAVIKETFAPLLESALVAITPLIPLIGGALVGAIATLSPLVLGLSTLISDNAEFFGGAVLAVGGLALAIKAFSFASMLAGWALNSIATVKSTIETGILMAMYAKDFVVNSAKAVGALALQTAAWAKNTAALLVSKAQTVILMAMYAKDFVVNLAKSAAGLAVSTGAWIANTAAQVAQKAVLVGGAIATGVATAAQWALNAAMSANPVMLVVLAIAALVAGLVWFFTQTELGKAIWTNFTGFLVEAWNNIVAVATAVFGALGLYFSTTWNSIVGFFQKAIAVIVDLFLHWTPLGILISNFGPIVQFFVTMWSNITGAVSTGVSNVVRFFSDLPGQAMAALGNLGALALDAGRSLVQGLINGINGMISSVRRAASNVMQAIANFFPHSPAKEGPFSGRGWTLYSGEAMGDGLVDGMDSRLASVRAAALAMTKAAAVDASAVLGDFDLQSSSSSTAGASKQVNLTVNNPIAEPTSETIRRGAQLVGAALV